MKKTRDAEQQLALAGTEEGEILARLSERVEKAVAMIQELRRERDQLRTRLEEAESKLRDSGAVEEECDRFRRERGEIRDRIESILSNLEQLDAAEE